MGKRFRQSIFFPILVLLVTLLLLLGLLYWNWCTEEGLRFVKQMGSGINIGNTLDVHGIDSYLPDADVQDFETAWGNPPISEELLQQIYSAGIRTIRIPVSWGDHLDSDGTIDPAWLDRVTEVVDQALDIGFYVIVNTHHEPWIIPSKDNADAVTQQLCRLWSQIAERFADRDTHLLFESMNEPRLVGTPEEWTSGTEESREIINQLNAAFVETIRSAGGWNETRWLLLPAYATQYKAEALAAMVLPEDPYLIVSVHAYIPHQFTSGSSSWASQRSKGVASIDEMMQTLDQLFLRRKIPVIITEFGCRETIAPDERLDWAQYYLTAADRLGIPCLWWDDGKNYCLINRDTLAWEHPEIVQMLCPALPDQERSK